MMLTLLFSINPVRYTVSTLIANELHGLRIHCTDSELTIFQPPTGNTCSTWAQAYVDRVGGYLSNPNASSDCGFCTYDTGDQFFAQFDIKYSERGRNIGVSRKLLVSKVITHTNFIVVDPYCFYNFQFSSYRILHKGKLFI